MQNVRWWDAAAVTVTIELKPKRLFFSETFFQAA